MRIAHVSDVHVLEMRPPGGSSYGMDVRFLSFGRRLDAEARIRKLVASIVRASACADHVVVTGDLTESGTDGQFEALALALATARVAPERLTLVPGNHDAYTDGNAWTRALAGPLRPFAPTSAMEPGKVVDLGELCLFPMDVSFPQPIPRSAGMLTLSAARKLDARLSDPELASRPQVVVQHHPPHPKLLRAWDWVDGLRGGDRMLEMLLRHPRMVVLHGHLHATSDHPAARVFGAPAVVDDEETSPRVRLYESRQGALTPVGLA